MTENENSAGRQQATSQQVAKALDQLTPEQVAEISPRFERERYAEGAKIIQQGEPADRFYIVASGEAEICHEDMSGSISVIEKRTPGEYFGEIGLFRNQPRTATVRAPVEGEVVVLALGHSEFEALMDDSRATEAHVAQEMMRRLINLADVQ